MNNWREFTVNALNVAEVEHAEAMALERPAAAHQRIVVDLDSVVAYWESTSRKGEAVTNVDTIAESYELVISFDDFHELFCQWLAECEAVR